MKEVWLTVAWAWMAVAAVTFAVLFFFRVTAPFGRHTRSDWGPLISNSLGWFVMEIPSLLCLWGSFWAGYSADTPAIAWLPMGLWSVHYLHRSVIYPAALRDRNKKMPLVVTFSAVFFNLVNGSLNGHFLAKGWFYQSPLLIAAGLIIFGIGMYINMRSDYMLIALRKPGETGYKLPKGFLFDKVTSPNLFGEIVEWAGFAVIVPGAAALSFLVWTLANLVPRARDHHEWYLKKFPDYPKSRNVLIPGIW